MISDHLRSGAAQARFSLQVLSKLRTETAARNGARMQITPEQGQFMAQLVRLLGVKRYIEVGVYTGYSSLAVALALPEVDALVVAIDRDPAPVEVARRYWQEAGVAHKVDCRIGSGEEQLERVLAEFGHSSFDMAFVGATGNLQRACLPRWLPIICLYTLQMRTSADIGTIMRACSSSSGLAA